MDPNSLNQLHAIVLAKPHTVNYSVTILKKVSSNFTYCVSFPVHILSRDPQILGEFTVRLCPMINDSDR